MCMHTKRKEANRKIWEERVECKAGINNTYKYDRHNANLENGKQIYTDIGAVNRKKHKSSP